MLPRVRLHRYRCPLHIFWGERHHLLLLYLGCLHLLSHRRHYCLLPVPLCNLHHWLLLQHLRHHLQQSIYHIRPRIHMISHTDLCLPD